MIIEDKLVGVSEKNAEEVADNLLWRPPKGNDQKKKKKKRNKKLQVHIDEA